MTCFLKLYDYVTVSRGEEYGIVKYDCTCEMYRISGGISCGHCKFLEDIFSSVDVEVWVEIFEFLHDLVQLL